MTRGVSQPVAVVFDGDDTLWKTEPLYDAARRLARDEVSRTALDGSRWEQLERRIDVQNVAKLGFSRERFPTSCVQAYDELCTELAVPADPVVKERIRAAANAVFLNHPELMEGAREILQLLRSRGFRLALLTKGDAELQRMRVKQSGLTDFFDAIEVVPEKTPETFRKVLRRVGVRPDHSWSVGNSVRSDILPALELGLRGVWIDAEVWEHERHSSAEVPSDVVQVASLGDISGVLSEHLNGQHHG